MLLLIWEEKLDTPSPPLHNRLAQISSIWRVRRSQLGDWRHKILLFSRLMMNMIIDLVELDNLYLSPNWGASLPATLSTARASLPPRPPFSSLEPWAGLGGGGGLSTASGGHVLGQTDRLYWFWFKCAELIVFFLPSLDLCPEVWVAHCQSCTSSLQPSVSQQP